jgi:hypothetical protein
MLKPRFSPVIELGHLIQAGVIGASAIVSVFAAYMGLRTSIDATNYVFDKRMTLVEQMQALQTKDDASWRGEMRAANQGLTAAMGQLSKEIADLRVGIANKADRK